jgi:hypothetical protein
VPLETDEQRRWWFAHLENIKKQGYRPPNGATQVKPPADDEVQVSMEWDASPNRPWKVSTHTGITVKRFDTPEQAMAFMSDHGKMRKALREKGIDIL